MKSLCERMAGQFSFGKTEVCMCMIFLPKEDCTVIPQLHICFASNTLARVVAEITSAFYRHDSQPKLDMPKQGIEYAGTIPVGCSLYHSWDHGPDSFTILWKGLRASWHLLLPFLSRRLRDQLSTSPFSFFFLLRFRYVFNNIYTWNARNINILPLSCKEFIILWR